MVLVKVFKVSTPPVLRPFLVNVYDVLKGQEYRLKWGTRRRSAPQTWLSVVPGLGGVVGGAALAVSVVEIFQRCPFEHLS